MTFCSLTPLTPRLWRMHIGGHVGARGPDREHDPLDPLLTHARPTSSFSLLKKLFLSIVEHASPNS